MSDGEKETAVYDMNGTDSVTGQELFPRSHLGDRAKSESLAVVVLGGLYWALLAWMALRMAASKVAEKPRSLCCKQVLQDSRSLSKLSGSCQMRIVAPPSPCHSELPFRKECNLSDLKPVRIGHATRQHRRLKL